MRTRMLLVTAAGFVVAGGLSAPAASASPDASPAAHITSVSPRVVRVGDRVTVTGSRLGGARAIRLGRAPATRVHVVSASKVTARVPATASSGRVAVILPHSTVRSARPLTVTASFTENVASGPPTTNVVLSGAGYGNNEAVQLRFDTTVLQVTSTNGTGNFGPITLAVPASAAFGPHNITAVGEHSGFSETSNFTVVTSWLTGGFGSSERRNNPYENQLSTANVDQLAIANRDNADYYGNRTPHLAVSGNLYVGTVLGNIYAYNAAGTRLWHASTGKDLQAWDPVAIAGKVIFAASDGTVFAYNLACRTDGGLCTPAWTQSVGASGPLNAAKNILYVPASTGGVHQLVPATGASAGADINPFGATTPTTSAVTVGADGAIWWSSSNRYTYVDPTGTSASSGPFGGNISTAAISDGNVYVTSTDGQLHDFGATSWSVATLGSGCDPAPAVAQGIVYAGSCSGLGAYDEVTGSLLWSVSSGDVLGLSMANGVVYACVGPSTLSGGLVVAYDARYGEKLWSGGSCNDTPEVVNGKLYAGVGAVNVYSTAPSSAAPLDRRRAR